MFLVGIAGSVLPYLILLGVVFAFSIQTPAQKSGYVRNDVDCAYRIDASLPASNSYFQTNYMFSSYGSHECSKEKSDYREKQSVSQLVWRPMQTIIPGRWIVRNDFQSDLFFRFIFSGLSPPTLCCFV
jgi:hypothetical protein